jgi:hypothetical protein
MGVCEKLEGGRLLPEILFYLNKAVDLKTARLKIQIKPFLNPETVARR